MPQITSNNSRHLCWGNWIELIKSRRYLFWIYFSPPFFQLLPMSLGCHWKGDTHCGLVQALSVLVTWAVSLQYTRAYFQDTCSNVVMSGSPSFYQTWLKMAKLVLPVTPSLMGSHLLVSISSTLVFNYLSHNTMYNTSEWDMKDQEETHTSCQMDHLRNN